jgi:hypothetical protein
MWTFTAEFQDCCVKTKIQVFWNMMTCRLVNSYQRFAEAFSLHLQGLGSQRRLCLERLYPEDGGSQNLRNVSNCTPICTVSYRRRPSKTPVI